MWEQDQERLLWFSKFIKKNSLAQKALKIKWLQAQVSHKTQKEICIPINRAQL